MRTVRHPQPPSSHGQTGFFALEGGTVPKEGDCPVGVVGIDGLGGVGGDPSESGGNGISSRFFGYIAGVNTENERDLLPVPCIAERF